MEEGNTGKIKLSIQMEILKLILGSIKSSNLETSESDGNSILQIFENDYFDSYEDSIEDVASDFKEMVREDFEYYKEFSDVDDGQGDLSLDQEMTIMPYVEIRDMLSKFVDADVTNISDFKYTLKDTVLYLDNFRNEYFDNSNELLEKIENLPNLIIGKEEKIALIETPEITKEIKGANKDYSSGFEITVENTKEEPSVTSGVKLEGR